MKNNKTFSERFDERFFKRINNILIEFEATPKQTKQFFTSELEDIIKEINELDFSLDNCINLSSAKQKIIEIIKNRI